MTKWFILLFLFSLTANVESATIFKGKLLAEHSFEIEIGQT